MATTGNAITPGRRRHRVMLFLQFAIMAMAAAQYTLVASTGFKLFSQLKEEAELQYAAVRMLDMGKILLAYAVLLYVGLTHMYRGIIMQRGRCLLSSRACRRKPSHWTVAASRGVFQESAKSVVQAHNLTMAFCGAIIFSTSIWGVVSMIMDPEAVIASDPEDVVHLDKACGPGLNNACRLGGLFSTLTPWVTAGFLLTKLIMILFTPVRFWSPVTMEAVRQTRNTRLWRCLNFLLPVCFVTCFWTLHLSILSMGYLSLGGGGQWAPYAYFFYSTALLLVVQVSSLLWFAGARLPACCRPIRAPRGHYVCPEGGTTPAAAADGRQPLPNMESQAHSENCPTAAAAQSNGDPAHAAWSAHGGQEEEHDNVTVLWRRIFDSSSGKRYHKDLILVMSIYLWVAPELTTTGDIFGLLFQWALRVAVGALLFLVHSDTTTAFGELYKSGTAFGLLVDAKQLRDALNAACSSTDQGLHYHRELRTFKASMFRMRETLAVSYRWQPEEVEIAPDVFLNMSQWQMKTLAEALSQSTAAYVWLDKMSVPQRRYLSLKQTLLSRMMAVYASAGVTLAMRSKEPDGSRYHQRGWTLQEYCASSNLLEAEESDPASEFDAAKSRFALAPDEMEVFGRLRTWCRQRASHCRPYWLYGGIAVFDDCDDEGALVAVGESFSRYREVSQRVRTEREADHLRALYPLLMNTPVENQEELVSLVMQVTEKVGEQEEKLPALTAQPISNGHHRASMDIGSAWAPSPGAA